MTATTRTTPALSTPPGPPPIPPAARAVAATRVFGRGELAVTALDRVDLAIDSGRLTAIMGPSGSGKSTLMHSMAGLDRLTDGRAFIGDIDLTTLGERQLTELRRERIGFVFQSFNLVPVLTAGENIELPLRLGGRRGDRAFIEHVIETVGLVDRRDHRPAELSGGQQQRVAVARALASRPEVIFADEPTGNLDRHAATEVLGLLRRATRDDGQTVAMVTHDPAAAAYADRVVFIVDGRVVADTLEPTVESLLDIMRDLEA